MHLINGVVCDPPDNGDCCDRHQVDLATAILGCSASHWFASLVSVSVSRLDSGLPRQNRGTCSESPLKGHMPRPDPAHWRGPGRFVVRDHDLTAADNDCRTECYRTQLAERLIWLLGCLLSCWMPLLSWRLPNTLITVSRLVRSPELVGRDICVTGELSRKSAVLYGAYCVVQWSEPINPSDAVWESRAGECSADGTECTGWYHVPGKCLIYNAASCRKIVSFS